jgi:hypothetical protein
MANWTREESILALELMLYYYICAAFTLISTAVSFGLW